MAKRQIPPTASGPGAGTAATGVVDGALLVQPKPGAAMSRLQRTFNGLVREVASLEQRLTTRRDDLELLLARYQARVAGPDRALAEAQFALARALADAHARLTLRGNQKKDLAATLCSLCEDAFLTMAPDAQTEALYDEWAGRSYREVFERTAGVHAEDPDCRFEAEDAATADDDPESSRDDETFAGLDQDDEWDGARRGRPRTADFMARQARRAEQAELTRRSVREVYLALARVLHPDAVADPAERDGREQAMKQATGAYRQNDLLGLLRLELQWINLENGKGHGRGDDTLRAYIRALRDQVTRLEDSLVAQAADPRYDAIAGLAFLPTKRALTELESRARQLRAATAELVELRAMVRGCESRQELAAIVRGARHDRA